MATFALTCVLLLVSQLQAWNGMGHMTVAYIAYQNLKDDIRAKVDALLKRNPDYKTWIKGVPADERGLRAFLMASTWPDVIKSKKGFTNDGNTPPADSTASQNIGFKDKLQHRYWHFIDHGFTRDGTTVTDPPAINAEERIGLFSTTLADASADPKIRSYDLTWLVHLVGDVHQPLHCTARFTKNHTEGDHGGNLVKLCKTAKCTANLHSFWDDQLGTGTDFEAIASLGDQLNSSGAPAGAEIDLVTTWTKDSFDIAQRSVYVSPINEDEPGDGPSVTDKPYRTQSHSIAEDRVVLAGFRLANLLNEKLK